jgi:hypothetical protein
MDPAVSVELRAERLRLFTALIGEEPAMCAGEGQRYGFVPGGLADAAPQEYPEDFALAWACAEVAHEVRERQWTALETFGAAWSAGDGSGAVERIRSLPADQARRALLAAYELGWHFKLPGQGR